MLRFQSLEELLQEIEAVSNSTQTEELSRIGVWGILLRKLRVISPEYAEVFKHADREYRANEDAIIVHALKTLRKTFLALSISARAEVATEVMDALENDIAESLVKCAYRVGRTDDPTQIEKCKRCVSTKIRNTERIIDEACADANQEFGGML